MSNRLIWLDLEMTGLDPDRDVILEIAAIVTDDQLEIVAEGPSMAIHQSEEVLGKMDLWSKEQHTRSGLIERVRSSPYSCEEAEQKTLGFLSGHCGKEESPLCGNSILKDRQFLFRHMPRLEGFLHYRNIDVSTIKELVRRWYTEIPPYTKQKEHLALKDIRESIGELRYYRRKVFLQ
ncbi:MAG: oligoribonuclease [Thermodesulfobacteriota bacterium]